MEKELQGKLVEILTQIQEATKAGVNWTLEQLPDVVMQFILYHRIWSSIEIVIGLAFISSCIFLIRAGIRLGAKKKWDDDASFPMVLGGGFGSIFAFAYTYFAVKYFTLVWFAPKVFLLQELARLVK